MNFASWVILGVVIIIVALAAKATFAKAKRGGGCCENKEVKNTSATADEVPDHMSCAGCTGCASCEGCSASHVLQPIIKPLK